MIAYTWLLQNLDVCVVGGDWWGGEGDGKYFFTAEEKSDFSVYGHDNMWK